MDDTPIKAAAAVASILSRAFGASLAVALQSTLDDIGPAREAALIDALKRVPRLPGCDDLGEAMEEITFAFESARVNRAG